MSETIRDGVTMSGFDETLPCSENTSLPQEVYELQTAYARINREDTTLLDSYNAETSPDTNKVRTEVRGGLSSPTKTDNLIENESERICTQKELQRSKSRRKVSTPRDHFGQKRSSATGTLINESTEDTPRAVHERDQPCPSSPSKTETSNLHGSDRNEINVQRSRKFNEPTNGTTAPEIKAGKNIGNRDPITRPKHDRKNRSELSKSDNLEKRENRCDTSVSKSTPVPLSMAGSNKTRHKNTDFKIEKRKDSKSALQQSIYPSSKHSETEVFRDRERTDRNSQSVSFSTDLSGKHTETEINKELRNNRNSQSVSRSTELARTSDAKRVANVSDQSPLTTSLKQCETAPVKLPSHHSSKEGPSEVEKVTADNLVASDTYFSSCAKCHKQERNTPATSYCVKCAHYLCRRCLRRHDRIETMKDHPIMTGNRMPGSFTVKKFEINRNLNEKCGQHTNRNIKCFCLDHSILCCTVCKSSDHAGCTQQSLDDLLIQMPDIQKLKHHTSEASIHNLNSLLKLRQTLKANAECSDKQKKSIIEEAKHKSSLLIGHIKKLEEAFIDHVIKTFDEDKSELDRDTEGCEKYINIISKDIQYLDEPKGKKESKLKTFEKVMQIAKMKLPDRLKNQLEKNETDERKPYDFEVNTELFNKITDMKKLGELVPRVSDQLNLSKTTDTENSSCTAEDDLLEKPTCKSVAEHQSLPGWAEGDNATSTCFTAIELIDDGSVLVADQKNWKLKLFDSDISLLQSTGVSSEPWGIAKLFGNKYIVTLPMVFSYQELEITDGKMTLCRKIKLGIECTCVIQTKNQLLFAGIDFDKPKLIFTDFDGNTKESVLTTEKLQLFKRPNHLLRSLLDPNIVIVSDVDKGVFALDIEKRDILFHYTHPTMKCAMGLTMKENGHIFICSQQSHSLHCISKDGQYLFSVSMENIYDMRKPQCICYLAHLNEFLITSDKNYSIVRFRLN